MLLESGELWAVPLDNWAVPIGNWPMSLKSERLGLLDCCRLCVVAGLLLGLQGKEGILCVSVRAQLCVYV
jgi:hypothetical protein